MGFGKNAKNGYIKLLMISQPSPMVRPLNNELNVYL